MEIARGELVEKELDAMIQCRARKGEMDPHETEQIWEESVRRYHARRREQLRAAWASYHEGLAASLRQTLGDLVSHHETQAERYRDQRKGA